jgi:hypothetical protein
VNAAPKEQFRSKAVDCGEISREVGAGVVTGRRGESPAADPGGSGGASTRLGMGTFRETRTEKNCQKRAMFFRPFGWKARGAVEAQGKKMDRPLDGHHHLRRDRPDPAPPPVKGSDGDFGGAIAV